MRIGYFDCFSGASGDMVLGALVAAGLAPDVLRTELAKLPLSGYELDIQTIKKQGFAAVKVDVRMIDKPGHRHLHHIVKIIHDAGLNSTIKEKAIRIFTRLAEAEASVHGTTVEKVHFHEVGAVDAIVDVVGAVIGIESLGLRQIICSPIPTGHGTVRCEHGLMPIPAPATAELLKGVPLASSEEEAELVTPTGAAILTTLADSYGPLPAMTITRNGYGAGSRDGKTRPNLLRLIVGKPTFACAEEDEVVVLETNLDDTTGQQIGHAVELLFAAGALDAFTTPIQMKKNRPGVLLTAIVSAEKVRACEDVLFKQTNTFGVRRHVAHRSKLSREEQVVKTKFGNIRVKLGRRECGEVIASPEYEDCVAAATRHGAPLRDVMFAAQEAWRAQDGGRA